jgi:acyl carrier protein
MTSEIRDFVIESLTDMNYEVGNLEDDMQLGPAGVDLESLALAELTVRIEDRFGVKFSEDEAEQLAGMTVGEFCTTVADRMTPATAA